MEARPPSLKQLHAFARERADTDGAIRTAVPGLTLMCIEKTGERVQANYRPLVCLVLQGAKHLTVGRQEIDCSQGEALVICADLPVTGQVVKASVDQPYLALAVELDMAILSEQAERLTARSGAVTGTATRTIFTRPTSVDLMDCARRLLQLVEQPEAVEFLHQGLIRELQYRLLTGPSAPLLHASVLAQSTASRLTPAIALLRERFRESLEIERLASAASMSRAAFHRHFKALTALTPVQYQKRLRLIEARRLLRHEAASATQAAYAVGYESVSQFTRDYSGLFGVTPGKERPPSLLRPSHTP
ncbi:AraC family transcriptional regulator [Aquabacterium sp.]|uniref:AraC family transcriptional regulator n=1 Tax=Aquabacterium sp. TaxID=1872578 RepID=UPI0025C42408|nr:AraC family transcriptional regulator [Aquabacterium sp.]